MLIELGVVEQRHKAVLEVMEGLPVTEVAGRYGVTRQTVHRWLRWYAQGGIAALADGSRRPATCPHRMAPEVEARIVALRSEHPGWGPRTLLHYLGREELSPLPGRSSVHRCLLRHGLIEPQKRRRKREDYRRWERLRAMELWQMDVMGGVRLAGGGELKVVTGIDDHSPLLRLRAAHAPGHGAAGLRGLPRRDAPPRRPRAGAHRQRQGVHGALRTRQGPRALRPHLPRERHPSPADRAAQPDDHRQGRALPQDGAQRVPRGPRLRLASRRRRRRSTTGSTHYNTERPHQGIGMVPPLRRFELAAAAPEPVAPLEGAAEDEPPELRPLTRLVCRERDDQLRGGPLPRRRLARRRGGRAQRCATASLEIAHRGVLVACHARRHVPKAKTPARTAPPRPRPRPVPPLASGPAVKRKVDPTGYVSFAGRGYFVTQPPARRAGRGAARRRCGADLAGRRAPQDARRQARPSKGARRLLDAAGTTAPQQRLPLLKGRGWNTSTGANA